ncbi:MAG: hypothetical protein ACOC1F_09570 [Myxococcota bacterium]
MAKRKLELHTWPGNVRELQNVIARAMVLCEESDIEPEAILQTAWTDQVDGLGPSQLLAEPVREPAASPAAGADEPLETFREFRERHDQEVRPRRLGRPRSA